MCCSMKMARLTIKRLLILVKLKYEKVYCKIYEIEVLKTFYKIYT